MCTYLHQRGSTYYFRRAIPVELRPAFGGRAEIVQSLRTKDRVEAKRKIPALTIETDRLLEAAAKRPEKASERLSQRVSAQRATREAAAFDAMLEGAALAEQEMNAREARYDAREPIRRRLEATFRKSTAEITPEEAAFRDMLRDAQSELMIAQERLAWERLRNAERRRGEPSSVPAARKTVSVPLLSTFDAYAAEQQIKPGTTKEWRAILEKLVAFLGHEDAALITVENLDNWMAVLLQETTKRGTKRDARTVKDKYLGAVRATLNWAVEKRKLDENVALKIVVRVPRKAKLRDRDFTTEEARAILSATLKPVSDELASDHAFARRWIPWLCAYTGARVNEISQLRGQDVQQVEGIWTIRITPEAGTVKANAARIIPLHSHLIDQGFPEEAKKRGEGPLFFNPLRQRVQGRGNRHFKKVGERLAAWVREEIGITDPGLQPNHGWRHTFKTRATEAGMSERIADAIQGHAPTNVSRTYGSVTLAAMAAAIETLPRFVFTPGKTDTTS